MSYVFVLDSERRPLDPVHPGRARRLLTERKAAVLYHAPFTIILTRAYPQARPQPLRLKIDPGSKTTGLAVLSDQTGAVLWAAELTHRGEAIRKRLADRRAVRRSRRQRKTRYRACRFDNRRRPSGWLPPSLESRIANVTTWVARLQRLCPITVLSQELVRFDTQSLQNPEIQGVEYQQGELQGFEVREYLLLKWRRTCAYCGATKVPLEVEHLVPKSRGGSDRVSNLALACHECNQAKGNRTADEWGYPDLQTQARRPLRDAAAVNVTRWALYERLKATKLPVEIGTGGLTKFNRTRRNFPKTHWCDAVCIGPSTPEHLNISHITPLLIEAMGRQRRHLCLVDCYGFPRAKAKGQRRVRGFATGDLVRAVVPQGKRQGTYWGRVAVKASGYFTITTSAGTVPDIAHRYCQLIQRNDGYTYQKGDAASSPTPEGAGYPLQ